jgi:BirA family transcriptional regulator, biotin operon repressor / biotin---[acetyl-CoA-carboxylase] ligase
MRRDAGRRIRQHEGVPGSPYTDLSRPPLHERELRRALIAGDGMWTRLRVVPVTGSTNADVAAQARAGAAEGLVIAAESQLAGRGRLDRRWVSSPRAGLTFSVLLRPLAVPAARIGWLPLLAGLAVAQAVGRLGRLDTALKWPNDVLLRTGAGYAKCGGLLAEAVNGEQGTPPAVVVGIGLNVSQRPDELPPRDPWAPPAISLAMAGSASTDRDPLLRAMLRALADWYGRWCAAAGDPRSCGLLEAYSAACTTLGGMVRVDVPGGDAVRGEAVEVDPAGRLVVATGDGDRRAIAAGDVIHLHQPGWR